MTDKLVRRPDDFERYMRELAAAPDGPPTIDSVAPDRGRPGDRVTLFGTNLEYVSVYFGPFQATVLEGGAEEVVVEIPDPSTATAALEKSTLRGRRMVGRTERLQFDDVLDTSGLLSVLVVGRGGFAVLPEAFDVIGGDVNEPGGGVVAGGPEEGWRTFTAPISDRRLRPTGTDYRYLAVLVLAADQSTPERRTASDVIADIQRDTMSASNHLSEASYGAFEFTTDVHPALVELPDPRSSYTSNGRPKRILGRGATFPVTFDSDATLTVSSGTFSVTVTFAAGTYTLRQVVAQTNDAIEAAAPNPSEPPIEAGTDGGQLELATTERGTDTELSVDGGTARSALGLDSPTVTAGLEANSDPQKAVADALEVVLRGTSRTDAIAFLEPYDGVFVVHFEDDPDGTVPRAHATFGQSTFELPVPDPGDPITVRLGIVQAHRLDDSATLAHEVGHNIQFPDLYDEPGPPEQVGVELGSWDLMAATVTTHPAAWIKAWKSGHYVESETSVEGTPWLTNVRDVYRPPPGERETFDVLLFPASLPFPTGNPYAELFPGMDLVHVLRFNARPRSSPGDGWTIYVEARERGRVWAASFGDEASFESRVPEEGVLVTDAVNGPGVELDVPLYRAHTTRLNSDILQLGDPFSYSFPDGTRLELSVQEVYTGDPVYPDLYPDPNAYKLHVDWGPDESADPSVRHDLYIRPWDAPPWESPDIWLDTAVLNEWDVYERSSPSENPDVVGSPVGNGDPVTVGEPARVYARVWNDGPDPATDVTVRFSVVVPPGTADGVPIGESTIPRIEPEGFGLARVLWTPRDTDEEHVCIQAAIVGEPSDYNTTNNVAQENVTDWYLERGSPYAPVESTVSVVNPLPETATIRLSVDGLRPGYHVSLPDDSITLAPDEQVDLPMRLWAHDWVPTDQTLLDNGDAPPVVSVTFSFPYGCTWVPFGGISGTAHTVDRVEPEVTFAGGPTGEGTVTVVVAPGSGPVVGAPVTVRLHATDDDDEPLRVVRTETDEEGAARASVVLPRRYDEDDEYEVRVFVAPTPRSGPAEARQRVRFGGDDAEQHAS